MNNKNYAISTFYAKNYYTTIIANTQKYARIFTFMLFTHARSLETKPPYTIINGRIRDVVVAEVKDLDPRESRRHLARDLRKASISQGKVVRCWLQGKRENAFSCIRSRPRSRHLRILQKTAELS